MSKHFENVLEQIHQLSRSEQLALIESIARILGADELGIITEQTIEENRRRLAAYDAGETEGIPYQEAMNYVREQLNSRR